MFRTDPGTKLDALAGGAKIAFEGDAVDEGSRTGWSVLVRARRPRSRIRPTWTTSTGSAVPVGAGCEGRYVSIRPVSITGRRIAMPANLRSPGGAGISRPGRCRDRHDGDTA